MEQKSQKAQDNILPLFRKDLTLYRGPSEPDGSPTFSLYDPIRTQYFKINWAESLILRFLRPEMYVDELCEEINKHSTLHMTPKDVIPFFNDAYRNGLLALPRSSEQMMEEATRRKIHPVKWLLYNYLYIRLPLFHPDRFLTDTIKYVRPLASNLAFTVYLL